ncbi:MAG: hypothetical protein ACE5NP_09180 [Anaerolineae bacterium]
MGERDLLIRMILERVPHCFICQRNYEPDDIQVVASLEGKEISRYAISLSCPKCHGVQMAFAVTQKLSAPQIIMDPTPNEWQKFADMPSISMDDVLDVHRALRNANHFPEEWLED